MNKDRYIGIDLSRFVAIMGMLLVHAATDLVMLPQERLNPGVDIGWPTEPSRAYMLEVIFANRARPLFILLAGVGISLIAARRTDGLVPVILKRAGYLFVLGLSVALFGWSDLVLCIYVVIFLLAPLLLRRSNAFLVLLGVALLTLPVAFVSSGEESGWLGVAVIVSQIGYFVFGMVAGRLNFSGKANR